jgi:hypothetical protein
MTREQFVKLIMAEVDANSGELDNVDYIAACREIADDLQARADACENDDNLMLEDGEE